MSMDVRVGIAAGAQISAVAGAYGYSYDPAFPRCHRVPQYDAHGNYLGSIRVCNAAPYE